MDGEFDLSDINWNDGPVAALCQMSWQLLNMVSLVVVVDLVGRVWAQNPRGSAHFLLIGMLE